MQAYSLALSYRRSLLPMFHHNIDEQSCFGKGQARNVLEVTQLERTGRFLFASGSLACTGGLMCSHVGDEEIFARYLSRDTGDRWRLTWIT